MFLFIESKVAWPSGFKESNQNKYSAIVKESNSKKTGKKKRFKVGEKFNLKKEGGSADTSGMKVLHSGESFRSVVLNKNLDNSFGYSRDDVNFASLKEGSFEAHDPKEEGEYPSFRETLKEPLVLVNVHDGKLELYLGPQESGVFIPGKHRSLSWAVPYENARHLHTQEDVHHASALPLDWSAGKHRSKVTFMVVPEGATIEYKIGSAAPQEGSRDPFRSGGGVQMRLKGVPKGTMLLTKNLIDKRDFSAPKGLRGIRLHDLYEQALKEHNANVDEEHQISKETAYRYQSNGSTDFGHMARYH